MSPVFEKQWLHALLLSGLLAVLVLSGATPACRTGQLWDLPTIAWFWIAAALPVAHQLLVWFCWRMQLHYGLLTQWLGDAGFTVYATLFAILGISRVSVVFLLAISNRDSLAVDTTILRVAAVFVFIPAAYLFYSVARYFGFKRAMGIDHFDTTFRSVPFVNKGIFRFTDNGMYVFGFFLMWVPGLWYASVAALWIALFNHLYIWVHYFATEQPDIRRIYGESSSNHVSSR